ncbi:alcohol dehydrogenase catalytic domain-containing protein [Nocardioides islandensis]|uniref:Alcohol dehydrogenase catalytic domain-containing protein n=1 Tax=Nocardioides islandensis TaxID=433663 RepID=A0A930VDA5_9ACTN|nr:alcohol dehydrogenase catalytic domain-containing protein [Nocardioides islandensis]MBF4764373.1 alcohol dehydrogenase catalytic domain-containing protein [Nocardioides islandensis]
MRAVVKLDRGRGCLLVHDRQETPLDAGQVRVHVAAASVCGTDSAFYESGDAGADLGMTLPRVLGHEVSGTVIELGPHSPESLLGARVAVETHLHCGECSFCRSGSAHNCSRMGILGVTVDGAFAERLVVPARSCFRIPDEIELETAALLESAGSAMHAVLRSGVNLAGGSVLISGAGPVGLVAAQIARALGARAVVLVEPNPHRRALAQRLGLSSLGVEQAPLDVADERTRSWGGFDVAFECSGAMPALEVALASVRREATVMSVGLVKGALPLQVAETLITRGLTLRGSWGRSLWETWERMSALVVAGQVDLASLITHRLPLSGLPEALDLMRGQAGKVVLDPALPDGPESRFTQREVLHQG